MSQPITNENAKLVHKSHCRIGEGVIWSVAEQALYWTDILGNIVYRNKNNVTESWPLQQSLTSIGFTTDNTLVGTFYDGFYALDLVNGVHKKIAAPDLDYSTIRFNDGAVDTHGQFWAGTMHTDDPMNNALGSLYRFDETGQPSLQDDNYYCTNGPCFTADGSVMYHTDTLVNQKIYRCELDAKGNFVSRSTFLHFDKEGTYPDGMCLDKNGNLWVALWGGWGVNQYSPDGTLLQHIELPVAQVTKCIFGGENLDTLFITTASEYLSDEDKAKQPLAGCLFSVKTNTQGRAENLYQHTLSQEKGTES
ncbi:SMP-30/gluconolactonase/LRE family protein [Pseudocolwellia agarivorans]|uniref:SMP-30/gluconolactonase/LRE family protein n=1 Tax=Pseudocolwellia agarivorans TaxID=1911682 RepID=UPI001588BEB7|nr:SMP-30/gluconolactonase/LRE family protein [Pseudocolwellia agarivorans]